MKKKETVTFSIKGKKVKQITKYDSEGNEDSIMYKPINRKGLSRDFHFIKKSPEESRLGLL